MSDKDLMNSTLTDPNHLRHWFRKIQAEEFGNNAPPIDSVAPVETVYQNGLKTTTLTEE
jgi:hypothetical protein